MKKKFAVLMSLALLCFVLVAPMALAQQGGAVISCSNNGGANLGNAPVGIRAIICEIGKWFNILIPILITAGVLFFIWGVVQYVISADEEQKTKGRDKMIYGLIGLAVIVGIWGLVGLLQNSLGLTQNSGTITVPQIPQ